jgi:hypothetical protein
VARSGGWDAPKLGGVGEPFRRRRGRKNGFSPKVRVERMGYPVKRKIGSEVGLAVEAATQSRKRR